MTIKNGPTPMATASPNALSLASAQRRPTPRTWGARPRPLHGLILGAALAGLALLGPSPTTPLADIPLGGPSGLGSTGLIPLAQVPSENSEIAMGAGASLHSGLSQPALPRLSMAASGRGAFSYAGWFPDSLFAWLDPSATSGSALASRLAQAGLLGTVISDGQFVWGPNVDRFDLAGFLNERGSPLTDYVDDIALWADYTSVNPQVLLTVLQMQHHLVDGPPPSMTADEVRSTIQTTSLQLAKAFYEHLYTFGSRRPTDSINASEEPLVPLADGSTAQLDPLLSSGTFAVGSVLGASSDLDTWQMQMSSGGQGSFIQTFVSMFPSADPTSLANDIDPVSSPPDSLLQFPFPLGATWTFGGPHSWNGDSTPPFSSMDFFLRGGTCAAPPFYYAVAAAGGSAYHPSNYSCWIEITHGGGWTTSYYHLRNTFTGSSVQRNWLMGSIACQTCAGGYATGPHVHFSLKYNGAYISLEGVKLTGWTVHVGSTAYTSGYIARDGVTLNPYASVLNDYDTYYPLTDHSLRFYGNGTGDIDRVKIRVDDPANDNPGPPVDVGGGDFTIEWWMKAAPGENNADAITCGANNNWVHGNTLLDRSRKDNDNDFGISMAGGTIAFGVGGAGTGDFTLCGLLPVNDGLWHHIAVERRRSDGHLWIFVDGKLDTQADGPDGDISYPDTGVPAHTCGPSGDQSCSSTDPFLVLGAGKFDLGSAFPPFSGWMDEMMVSNSLRHGSNFSLPSAAYSPDASTVALYHFDEGTGTMLDDLSGYPGGPSNGLLSVGGSPAGPVWSDLSSWSSLATPYKLYFPMVINQP